MRRLGIILLILASTCFISAPAQVKVTGRVIDVQNKPVCNVIVKLLTGKKTLAFTVSNVQGVYALELNTLPQNEVSVEFTHISYEKETETLILKGNTTLPDMVLLPKTVQLKEVTVKGNPLWQRGDTLSHSLAMFLGKGDVTLEDGLKRLPGVEVGKSGSISYMGRPISQFNIEGLDLLGGKYNLATRNIPADYVTNVQIIRNHHARKVDNDVPSDEVAMNIKLSKKAKFKPFGQEETGVGFMQDGNDSFQGLLGLTGMMFTDNFQTICSLKGGNYKDFAKSDMTDHFESSGVSTPATRLFGGFNGGTPPMGEYLYQRNAMVTLNGISKLDSVTTFKVNADYSYNRNTHDIGQSTTYLTGENDYVTVGESFSPLSKIHLPKLTINYEKNAAHLYVLDRLVLKGQFEQNEGAVTTSQSSIDQHRRISSFEVVDKLYWIKKTQKGARRAFETSVSFMRTPTLHLSFRNLDETYGQTAQSSTLDVNIGTTLTLPVGKILRLSLPVRMQARYDNVETHRTATGDVNHIKGWNLNPNINAGFDIHSKDQKFYLSAGLGATLKGLYYNTLNYTKTVLNPSVSAHYSFSANSKCSFSTGYSTRLGDMMSLFTQPMQVNYRTVSSSSGIIGESNTWSSTGGWKWQLPLQYFTLSLSASHNVGKRNTLNSQQINGIEVSNNTLLRNTHTRNTNFSASTTKSIPSLFAKFGMDATYGFGRSEQAVSETVIRVRSNNYGLHGNVSITPISWVELRYDIRYDWAQTHYDAERNTVTALTHTGAVHVFPIAALDLSVDYNHVRQQIATQQYKNMSLFNAAAQYKFKHSTLRLELENLLNLHSYAYTVFDGINTYSYDYGLCGRTVMLRITFKL